MKISYSKQTAKSIAMMMMTVFALVSCSMDDNYETTPECVITDFSVNSITSDVDEIVYDSNGEPYTNTTQKTLYSTQIHFNIDQVNARIYTTDSLPHWVDLSAVVPNIVASGNVYYRLNNDEELYYPVNSGVSAIDFTETRELMVTSTDGLSQRIYKVDMLKHKATTDTLEWEEKATNLSIAGAHKSFFVDGKVFVFGKNTANQPVVTSTSIDNAQEWSTPVSIPVSEGSIVYFNHKFYGLSTDGIIYSATPAQANDTWVKASDKKMERLLASDAYHLYAYDGTSVLGTSDLTTWTEQGRADLDMLPEKSINAVSYASASNNNLQVAVMAGLTGNNSENGVTWCKTSTSDESTNQPWAYIQVTGDNSYGMPHFGDFSMTYFLGAIYAIGTEEGEYASLYRSYDNGITWHALSDNYPLPKRFKAENGVASIVSVNNNLWIIQENGKVWQGSIR